MAKFVNAKSEFVIHNIACFAVKETWHKNVEREEEEDRVMFDDLEMERSDKVEEEVKPSTCNDHMAGRSDRGVMDIDSDDDDFYFDVHYRRK